MDNYLKSCFDVNGSFFKSSILLTSSGKYLTPAFISIKWHLINSSYSI